MATPAQQTQRIGIHISMDHGRGALCGAWVEAVGPVREGRRAGRARPSGLRQQKVKSPLQHRLEKRVHRAHRAAEALGALRVGREEGGEGGRRDQRDQQDLEAVLQQQRLRDRDSSFRIGKSRWWMLCITFSLSVAPLL